MLFTSKLVPESSSTADEPIRQIHERELASPAVESELELCGPDEFCIVIQHFRFDDKFVARASRVSTVFVFHKESFGTNVARSRNCWMFGRSSCRDGMRRLGVPPP